MYYEINVSLKGTHYFATSERSITDELKLKVIYEQFSKIFAEKDGYVISVTLYETKGKVLSLKTILGG